MRRVRPNRCGYSGYTCVGLSNTPSVFNTKKIVADTTFNSVSENTLVPSGSLAAGWSYIDNYLNLPVKIKGSITTADLLLGMDAGVSLNCSDQNKICPPEISCRTNYDPFTAAGFLDLYTNVYSNLIVASVKPIDNTYSAFAGRLLQFTSLNGKGNGTLDERIGTEYELYPGIIEPMIDTNLTPVGVEATTAFDAGLDIFTYIAWEFDQWRIEVDKRLNELSVIVEYINNIEAPEIPDIPDISNITNTLSNLSRHFKGFRSMFRNRHNWGLGTCPYFKITIVGNNTKSVYWGTHSAPHYNVQGGVVKINGQSINVTGLTNVTAPFWAYVNVSFGSADETTGQYQTVTATLATQQGGDYSIGIGGVAEISSESGSPKTYKMYEIIQERCYIDEDVIRTAEDGILEKLESGQSPYGVRKTRPCNQQAQSGASEQPSAQPSGS